MRVKDLQIALRVFQYQKGAIKTWREGRWHVQTTCFFQYQKGAIKTGEEIVPAGAVVEDFQYQKGAIKTHYKSADYVKKLSFQYQKGAIKTVCAFVNDVNPKQTFNTKKVRLKHVPDILDDKILSPFNTKKVRLKRNTSPTFRSKLITFQYQKGAIKTLHCDLRAQVSRGLSIPKRCD